MQIVIRRATAGDAEAVREIVLRALRESNARDYPASVIDRLVLTLPDKVASNLETHRAFVAIVDGRVVGTRARPPDYRGWRQERKSRLDRRGGDQQGRPRPWWGMRFPQQT